jgi:hypothetical protein
MPSAAKVAGLCTAPDGSVRHNLTPNGRYRSLQIRDLSPVPFRCLQVCCRSLVVMR